MPDSTTGISRHKGFLHFSSAKSQYTHVYSSPFNCIFNHLHNNARSLLEALGSCRNCYTLSDSPTLLFSCKPNLVWGLSWSLTSFQQALLAILSRQRLSPQAKLYEATMYSDDQHITILQGPDNIPFERPEQPITAKQGSGCCLKMPL